MTARAQSRSTAATNLSRPKKTLPKAGLLGSKTPIWLPISTKVGPGGEDLAHDLQDEEGVVAVDLDVATGAEAGEVTADEGPEVQR